MNKHLILFLLANFSVLLTRAQEKEMVTDRPGQSRTPVTTAKNALQVETGFSEQYGQKHEEFLYPAALIKYGLSEKLDISLFVEYEGDYDFIPSKHNTGSGFKPLQLGVKYQLTEERGWVPNTSVVGTLAWAKIASPYFRSDFMAPGLIFAMENKLSKLFSITYNLGVEWEAPDVQGRFLYTLTPQFSLTDKLHLFGEMYGFLFRDNRPDHRIDAGIAYQLTSNFQVDVAGGAGVSRAAPSRFFEAGFSFRLPH